MEPRHIEVRTAAGSREDAEKIARRLVDERLAACVQISGPVSSRYHWKGSIETSEEWVCTAKTRRDLYRRVEEAILQLHPYETPEITATEITAGSRAFLAWIAAETGTSSGAQRANGG